jgi:hypothetical protein
MAELNSDINFLSAKVFHKRILPKINQFNYNIFYLGFDLDKIDQIKSKFLSVNKLNLFSFYFSDHANRNGDDLKEWIYQILAKKNLDNLVKKIYLMTQPSILGYVFNPVSFWFCFDDKNQLIAVLAEVSNTFSEHHNYLIFNQDFASIKSDQTFETNKEFHVSPFFKVEGKYKFRFLFDEKKIAVNIDYSSNNGEKLLLTSVVCERKKLTDKILLINFFKIPLMTFKVIFLIHLEALKIVSKGIKYIKKPTQLDHKITYNNE